MRADFGSCLIALVAHTDSQVKMHRIVDELGVIVINENAELYTTRGISVKTNVCFTGCQACHLPSAIMHTSLWQMKLITFKALFDSTYQSDTRDIDSSKHIAVSTQITQSK